MKKLFVGNLPSSSKEPDIIELFSQFGTVRSIKLATDIFSGQCKGFGFIEMEGHEARAAMERAYDTRDESISLTIAHPDEIIAFSSSSWSSFSTC